MPQLRGDGTSAAKFFIFGLLTSQIYTIYMCFKYNEIYIRGLVEKGFVMVPTLGADPNLVSAKLGFSLPLEEIEQK